MNKTILYIVAMAFLSTGCDGMLPSMDEATGHEVATEGSESAQAHDLHLIATQEVFLKVLEGPEGMEGPEEPADPEALEGPVTPDGSPICGNKPSNQEGPMLVHSNGSQVSFIFSDGTVETKHRPLGVESHKGHVTEVTVQGDRVLLDTKIIYVNGTNETLSVVTMLDSAGNQIWELAHPTEDVEKTFVAKDGSVTLHQWPAATKNRVGLYVSPEGAVSELGEFEPIGPAAHGWVPGWMKAGEDQVLHLGWLSLETLEFRIFRSEKYRKQVFLHDGVLYCPGYGHPFMWLNAKAAPGGKKVSQVTSLWGIPSADWEVIKVHPMGQVLIGNPDTGRFVRITITQGIHQVIISGKKIDPNLPDGFESFETCALLQGPDEPLSNATIDNLGNVYVTLINEDAAQVFLVGWNDGEWKPVGEPFTYATSNTMQASTLSLVNDVTDDLLCYCPSDFWERADPEVALNSGHVQLSGYIDGGFATHTLPARTQVIPNRSGRCAAFNSITSYETLEGAHKPSPVHTLSILDWNQDGKITLIRALKISTGWSSGVSVAWF